MIRYAQGDIFETPADIRINTVNCVGVMGAGVALAFKTKYPEMFKEYAKACKAGEVRPGKPHVWEKHEFDESVTVVNLPTKDHWRQPSEYEYIEKGLRWLHDFIEKQGNVRVAVPALGCGHGGLEWSRVQSMMEAALGDLEAEVIIFGPSSSRSAGDRVDDATLAKLEEQGIKALRPGDQGYPESMRGRSDVTIYIRGDVAHLERSIVAVLPSVKPSDRELKGVVACVKEIARPGLCVLAGYSPKADRPVIRAALEQGAYVIICLVEGILQFDVRGDLKDVWDEDRITVISAAKPQQKRFAGGLGKATALKLSLSKAALISDPSPDWMRGFARDQNEATRSKVFYLDYGDMRGDDRDCLKKVHAKPIGRCRDSGKPNVSEVLDILGLSESAQEQESIGEDTKHDSTASSPDASTIGEDRMPYPKRLIEVDLPIKRISAHARREKSIRHGHISTLHIWWARRPLAACRAVVCASLWPDPGDATCPPRFIETAKRLMTYWGKECLLRCSGESYPRFNKISKTPDCLDDATELRKALLDFIADFANWDNSTDAQYLAVARVLTVAAHDALDGHGNFCLPKPITTDSLNEAIKDAPRPLLVDPFAGGGAIPLEGLRCGADAFASDLNPVAVLLNRVVLEFIPKYGHRLADDVRKWGQWVRELAQKELSPYYPTDKDGAIPIAYLWARTVACEGPGCGVDIPLVGRALFASSKNESRAFRFRAGDDKHVHVEIVNGSKAKSADGTCKGFVATCPVCGYSTPKKSVQRQLAAKRGGADDSTLLTVLTLGPAGRRYREASAEDFEAFELAKQTLSGYAETSAANGLTAIPSEPIPGKHTHRAVGSQLPLYGFKSWGDLFNSRQLISILILQNRVRDAYGTLLEQTNEEYAKAIFVLLSFAIDKQADYLSSLCRWVSGGEFITGALAGEKKLSMISDFAEANPVGPGSGSWENHINWIARFLERESCVQYRAGTVCNASADDQVLPSDSASAMITDPPYYDSVPYADLSDFYYVWLKRTLAGVEHFPEESLTPKSKEMTVNAPNNADQKARYESLLTGAFQNGREVSTPHGIGLIVFAHKSTSGWETLLEAIHSSGWTITASWPIDTERSARPNAIQTASLASSVHIVCRPREDEDGRLITRVGDWRDVLAELPERIAQWLPRLSSEGVVGADAIFACLGPALEIFSRYSSVEKASGEVVPLREYLELVWAEVARQALNMIFEDADASGFEEDARLTAMWLWTLRTDANGNGEDDDKTISLPGYSLEYDAARKIAQGLGCHLENLSHLVEAKGETAMLLSAESRARYLFGKSESGTQKAKARKKKDEAVQPDLFSLMGFSSENEDETERAELDRPSAGKTVLDQLHQAMLLFTAGRGQALKHFLVDDGIGTNPQFWTLAQALSALYPAHTNEKRWVDGVLARKKGLGL